MDAIFDVGNEFYEILLFFRIQRNSLDELIFTQSEHDQATIII